MDQYNPEVRAIIIRLLTGLKAKQAIFRDMQNRSKATPAPHPERRTLAQQRAAGLPSRPSPNMQPPPADAFRPPRMRVPESSSQGSIGRRTPSPEPPRVTSDVVRHTLTDPPLNRERSPSPQPPRPTPTAPQPPTKTAAADMNYLRMSRDSDGNPRPESRFSLDSEVTHTPVRVMPSRQQTTEPQAQPALASSAPTPAPSLPILSLPDPEPEPSPTETPEAIASLAALQRSDALERRASKRFSSYTFNKMLPGTGPASPQRPMRRASRTAIPPLPNLPSAFGTGEIGFLVEESEVTPPLPERRRAVEPPKPSPPAEPERPVTPPRRSKLASSPLSAPDTLRNETHIDLTSPIPDAASFPPQTPGPIPIFLQLGRQIKKAVVEPGLPLASLRILFMEKFDYDPGMETFPDVYIRDPKVGVQYELEDMEDVKEGTMLSLNIERELNKSVPADNKP
jgi:hypothetical protein